MRKLIIITLVILAVGCRLKTNNADSIMEGTTRYSEKYRPQVHFTPDSMWMNDPNGMFYYEGEYHLFYQYYPGSNVWGPMHWGHAISNDLVHWEHLPIALYPDSLGYIYSGSAFVDWNNTSGFGIDGVPPLIAVFTYNDRLAEEQGKIDYQTQGIAYSVDKGRTWTKYENNPVLTNPGIKDFRDPKVRWYQPQQKWIMSLAVKDRIGFYSSKDLKNWQHESDFQPELGAYGGVWECPDLFPLKDKDTGEEKWVLFVSINPGAPNGGSGTQYFVGSFDGHEFVNENKNLYWLDYGKDNYAGVTWSDIPEEDGRTLFIGWMSNWQYATKVPTEKWRSAMTVTRELKLKSVGDDFIVTSMPVNEFETLRKEIKTKEQLLILNTDKLFQEIKSPCEFILEFGYINHSEVNSVSEYGFSLQNEDGEEIVVSYNSVKQELIINRDNSGISNFSENFKGLQHSSYLSKSSMEFRVIVDWSSIEIFVNNGERVMTSLVFPKKDYRTIKAFTKDGGIVINKAIYYELKSIWTDN